MRILSLIHGRDAGPGVFGEEIVPPAASTRSAATRSAASGAAGRRATTRALVFGGSMNVHEEDGASLARATSGTRSRTSSTRAFRSRGLPREPAHRRGRGRHGRTRDRARDRLVRGRDDRGGRDRPASSARCRSASRRTSGTATARPSARRGRARDEPGLPPGLPARGQRLGHAVPRRGHVRDLQRLDLELRHRPGRDRPRVRPGRARAAAVAQNIDRWNEIGRELARGFLGYVSAGRVAA